MRIELKDFAKIKEADIEINGISVIAGENNTGKSTVGKAIYSLFDSFYNIKMKVNNERVGKVSSLIKELGYFDDENGEFQYIDLDGKTEEIYNKFLEIDLLQMSKQEIIDIYGSILSDYVTASVIHQLSTKYEEILLNIYSVMSLSEESIRKTIVNRVFLSEFSNQVYPLLDMKSKPTLKLQIKSDLIELEFNDEIEIKKYIPITYQIIYLDNPFLLDSVNENMFFRRRFNGGHSASTITKLRRKRNPSIIDETMAKDKIAIIKNKINETIHGEFIMEDSVIKFKEEGYDSALNITNLSTGIKSIASLLRLLENNYIIHNSTIILDEPEVNLHPQWQIRLAEILVIMQKELNLHILLNTHSPYFISAIESYSAKYHIANLCKYYLSDLINSKAVFKDVTTNIDKIYDKLAAPFQILADVEGSIHGED
ncbi:ATP-binding protein [Amedibacillus sp. YH-ame10]